MIYREKVRHKESSENLEKLRQLECAYAKAKLKASELDDLKSDHGEYGNKEIRMELARGNDEFPPLELTSNQIGRYLERLARENKKARQQVENFRRLGIHVEIPLPIPMFEREPNKHWKLTPIEKAYALDRIRKLESADSTEQ